MKSTLTSLIVEARDQTSAFVLRCDSFYYLGNSETFESSWREGDMRRAVLFLTPADAERLLLANDADLNNYEVVEILVTTGGKRKFAN